MKLKNGMWCNANLGNLERLKKLNLQIADNIMYALEFKANFYIKNNVVHWGHKKCIGYILDKNYWSKNKKINFKNMNKEIR